MPFSVALMSRSRLPSTESYLRRCASVLRVRDVVDRDEVDVPLVQRCPHDVAADPAEPVDPYSDGHTSPDNSPRPSSKQAILYGSAAGCALPTAKSAVYTAGRRKSFNVFPLQRSGARVFRGGLALVPVSGDSLQEVHRQPRPADGLPARVVQHGRGAVNLDSRGVGRRSAHGAAARARPARALPALRVFLSTTTLAGQQLARRSVQDVDAVFYFPFDLNVFVRRTLNLVRPRLFVMMETEIWPNLLRECRRRGIKTAIVNGRLSPRSYPRYRLVRGFMRMVLGRHRSVLRSERASRRGGSSTSAPTRRASP